MVVTGFNERGGWRRQKIAKGEDVGGGCAPPTQSAEVFGDNKCMLHEKCMDNTIMYKS